MGKSAINSAKQLLDGSDELKTLSLVFEMIDLTKKEHDVNKGFQKIQTIKCACPNIESLSDTLIKTEALREWFDKAYYDFLFTKMLDDGESLEKDIELKAKYAMELTNSTDELLKLFAHTFLSDALYDGGRFEEAKRYAKLGMDIIGVLTVYNHDDWMNSLWGMCFSINARSQEKVGDLKDALGLFEQGVALGIPWCQQDLERLKQEANVNKISAVSSTVNNADNKILEAEQDYLDMLKERLEDGEIGIRERELLEKIREKNAISVERAKELEASLCSPQLTDDEKEYLELYQKYATEGAISEKDRRRLDKFALAFGISQDRIKELEGL